MKDYQDRHYKVCIVDADSILYKAAAAATETTYEVYNTDNELEGTFKSDKEVREYLKDLQEFLDFDVSGYRKEKVVRHKTVEDAVKAYESAITNIKKRVSADTYRFYIGEGKLHRVDVATLYEYKGSRKGVEKPHFFYPLKELVKKMPEHVVVSNGLEVDDCVSQFMYRDFKNNGENSQLVVACIDKDLRNTAGTTFDYDSYEWTFTDQATADFNFAKQMLTGDWSTDGIKGLPDTGEVTKNKYGLTKRKGCGKVTAESILEGMQGKSLKELYMVVLDCYKDFYGDSHTYTSWDGKELTKTPEEILDENCELLFMQRNKGERWLEYKEKYL